MKKFLICVGLVLALSACGSDLIIRFDLNPNQNVKAEPAYKGRSHFFFWGMWQEKTYDMANVCPTKGISAIENHWTFYDSFMGSMTMGIYAPESYSIYCN